MNIVGYGSLFILTIGVFFIPMFFVVRHFESINVFDSIGTGYTIYVSLTFSVVPALLAYGIKYLKGKHNLYKS